MSAVIQPINQFHPHGETLAELRVQLDIAKKAEAEARFRRVAVEERIVKHADMPAKEEGTVTADGLKITTGYTRKWDQTELIALAEGIEPNYWPFKLEWKEDRAASKLIEERFPDMWRVLSPALTLTPKKPAVSLATVKEEA